MHLVQAPADPRALFGAAPHRYGFVIFLPIIVIGLYITARTLSAVVRGAVQPNELSQFRPALEPSSHLVVVPET